MATTLKEAIFLAAFVGIDAASNSNADDNFLRVDYTEGAAMVEGSEEHCLFVSNENSGDEYVFTWDEIVEMQEENCITFFSIQPIEIG